MTRRLAALLLLLSGFLNLSCSSPEPVPFTHYFEKVRTIELSEEVLINRKIQSLDVREDGDLLVTDIGHVYLFDSSGRLKKALDPAPCHPGFQMRPISAHFRPDGKILMFNSGGGAFAFLFNEDGSCWKAAHEDVFVPSSFAFAPNGQLYGHYLRPDADSSQIKVLTGDGKMIGSFKVPASEHNNIDFRMGGKGAMVYSGNRIYHALPSGSAIYVYSREGKRADIIDNPPSYHKPVTTNIPGRLENPMKNFHKYLAPINNQNTLTQSLFLLNGNRLIVQYKDDDKHGIDVLNLEGSRLIDGPMKVALGEQIRQAKQGKVYRTFQPEPGEDGQVPNPRVEVYRFNR